MIYRHFNAPSYGFSPFSHEIIRHPRLTSHAVRLLTWQLSLPEDARETLSRTAERAKIGSDAFIAAKRLLIAERFIHERRVQVAGGRWVTQQIVSSTPMSHEQALKIFSHDPRLLHRAPASSQVAPGPGNPAAGAPETRPTGGHPDKHLEQNTSYLPEVDPWEVDTWGDDPWGDDPWEVDTWEDAPWEDASQEDASQELDFPESNPPEGDPQEADAPESDPQEGDPQEADVPDESETPPAPGAVAEEARAVVGAFPLLSPALRHIPPGMRDELARLVARWLDAGHTSVEIHAHVLDNLPADGTRVHRPGGLVRYLLREVPPRKLPEALAALPRQRQPQPQWQPPSTPQPPPWPRPLEPSGRFAGWRECEGEHTQEMLFRPVADETHCRQCASRADTGSVPVQAPRPAGLSGR